jgi:23S rRNA pseudouridine2605 synthase
LTLERLQKVLSKAGIASRRVAERMILEGRVTVNGQVVDKLGVKADPFVDHIKVDGKRVKGAEPHVVLLLNKPRGYVTTVKDPQQRPTVMDLLERVDVRVYPVGRLDFDAEGLVLMTNDGGLAYRLTHPKFSVPRTYLAKVMGAPDEGTLNQLKKGVLLEDGQARALSLFVLQQKEKNSWIRVVVTEGRNHLVKRLFEAVGHPVLKLKRIGFGPISLGNLPVGQFRSLTAEEVKELKGGKSSLRRPEFGGGKKTKSRVRSSAFGEGGKSTFGVRRSEFGKAEKTRFDVRHPGKQRKPRSAFGVRGDDRGR